MAAPDRELVLPLVTDDNICLPLSVNAVARYWGADLPMSEAAEIAKKYPGMRGSILIEGMDLAGRHGLASAVSRSSLPELKGLVDAGIPPIVILPGVRDVAQHASVISGYDAREKTVMHYIPEADGDGFKVGVIPEARFDSIWAEDGRIAIAIAPPEVLARVPVADADAAESSRLCFVSERQALTGDAGGALASLLRAAELDPGNSTAHALLGSAYNGRGSPECVAHYERSIGINPRSFLAHRGLGNHYLKAGDSGAAERHYTAALGINPDRYAPVYKNRAIARMALGRGDEARADLAEYLRRMPGAPDAAQVRQAMGGA